MNKKVKKHINVKVNKEKESSIPRMMTVRQVAQTGILPENTIRTLLKQQKIPAVYAGNKALINFDTLCFMLNNLQAINTQGDLL